MLQENEVLQMPSDILKRIHLTKKWIIKTTNSCQKWVLTSRFGQQI
jgi:hypothetical protein